MPSTERLLLAAEGYLELEMPEQALRILETVPEEGQDEYAFTFHSYSAQAYRNLQRYPEAIPHLLSARAERPDTVGIYLDLGWCYKRTNQIDDAIESLIEAERVCRLAQDQASMPIVLYNLSCYFSIAGNKPKMLRYLKLALHLEPKYRDSIPDEPDFDPFREDKDFLSVTAPIV